MVICDSFPDCLYFIISSMHQIQGHRIYRASIVWPKRQPEPVRPGLGSNRDSATLPLYSTATLYSTLPLYSILYSTLYSTLPLYSTHHSVPLRPIHLKYAGPAWCCYTTLRPRHPYYSARRQRNHTRPSNLHEREPAMIALGHRPEF